MKRLAILLSALLWLQTAASGAEPWFRYFSDGHAVIKQGSLYGFADRNGAEVIPCRYTKAYPFNDGIAMVRQGYEVFAIDTLGNRLGTRVKIPQFYNQDFEYFVRWVCSRLPFVSDNEYAQLRSEVVNAVVTIGRDGRITGCESVSACDPRALRKVRSIVMEAPAWSPGLVDGEPVEIRYLLPVNFRHLRPMRSTHRGINSTCRSSIRSSRENTPRGSTRGSSGISATRAANTSVPPPAPCGSPSRSTRRANCATSRSSAPTTTSAGKRPSRP